MKFPVYSLKTGILAQLTFLIIAAMLLINVVMVKFAERDLTQERLHTGRLLIRAVEQTLGSVVAGKTKKITQADLDFDFRKGVSRMLADSGFSDILLISQEGNKIFTTDYSSEKREIDNLKEDSRCYEYLEKHWKQCKGYIDTAKGE